MINAYKSSTILALENASVITKTVYQYFELTFEYNWMSSVMNAIKRCNVNIVQQNFNENGQMKLSLPLVNFQKNIDLFFIQIFDLQPEMLVDFEFPSDFIYTIKEINTD